MIECEMTLEVEAKTNVMAIPVKEYTSLLYDRFSKNLIKEKLDEMADKVGSLEAMLAETEKKLADEQHEHELTTSAWKYMHEQHEKAEMHTQDAEERYAYMESLRDNMVNKLTQLINFCHKHDYDIEGWEDNE